MFFKFPVHLRTGVTCRFPTGMINNNLCVESPQLFLGKIPKQQLSLAGINDQGFVSQIISHQSQRARLPNAQPKRYKPRLHFLTTFLLAAEKA